MHSPEPWGKASAPLDDLEWANLKARIYATIKRIPAVQDRALICQHFVSEAPFIREALGELIEEGVVRVESGALILV